MGAGIDEHRPIAGGSERGGAAFGLVAGLMLLPWRLRNRPGQDFIEFLARRGWYREGARFSDIALDALSIMIRHRKIVWRLVSIALFTIVLLAIIAHLTIESAAAGFVFDSVEACPAAPVALLLGVGRNSNYRPRIHRAAELFAKGKVQAIIVSGDNSRFDYNEPGMMKADLVALGVPERVITCDFAGLRTLDSVARAQKIFGQSRFIVVSQRYHCTRAVFLAHHFGVTVFGVSAGEGEGYASTRDRLRESIARVKALWDVASCVQPRFKGPRESVIGLENKKP